MNESLSDILLHGLAVEPDKISEIHEEYGTVLKCCEIRQKSILAAKQFRSMNISIGDVATFACRNFPDLSSLICGCIISGIIVNPVDPSHTTEEFKRIIDNTKPKIIFCGKNNKNQISIALQELHFPSLLIDTDNETSIISWFENVSPNNDYQSCLVRNKTNNIPILILETAGSTGLPKYVVLTNKNVISQLLNLMFINKDDILSVSPYMHLLSGIGITLIGIATGAKRIVTCKFNTETHLKLIEKYKITKMLMSTAYLSALADSNSFKTTDLSSIKVIQTSGEALMKTLRELVENQLLNGKIITSYCLLECCGTVTLNYPIYKEYSVGQPVLENKIKIIDEFGNIIGPRQSGEVCIKPPHCFSGYYLNEALTREVIDDDGYIHSGDIGYFDSDNYLFIVGRMQKNILKPNLI